MSYILIVEDEAILGELLHDVLEDEGYAVRYAATALEGLRIARERQPALVLFDLTLPDLSGADFVVRYRQLGRAPGPLIAVSAVANLAAVAAQVGADDFVVKPFKIDDLLAVVARALG
jgi:DNA-binding response OmpR family regulator